MSDFLYTIYILVPILLTEPFTDHIKDIDQAFKSLYSINLISIQFFYYAFVSSKHDSKIFNGCFLSVKLEP